MAFIETHESVLETYDGDEEAAHRTAWSAVKHQFEKVGDHWSPRTSGVHPTSAPAIPTRNDPDSETAGGVDVRGHTRDELYERARKLHVSGRSDMDKQELGQALARTQD